MLIGLFRSRASLQAEILTLRHQLNVLRRKSPQRLTFSSIDRLVFAGLYGLAPGVLDTLKIVRPETVIRWHRAGFRAYWRWKSRPRGGRLKTTPFGLPKTPFRAQFLTKLSRKRPGQARSDPWHAFRSVLVKQNLKYSSLRTRADWNTVKKELIYNPPVQFR